MLSLSAKSIKLFGVLMAAFPYAESAYSLNPMRLGGEYVIDTPECAQILNDETGIGLFAVGATVLLNDQPRYLSLRVKAGGPREEVKFFIGQFSVVEKAGADPVEITNQYLTGRAVFKSSLERPIENRETYDFQMIRQPSSVLVSVNWGERSCELRRN